MRDQASADAAMGNPTTEWKHALKPTRRPYWVALALGLLALPAFAVDMPLARSVQHLDLPGDLDLLRVAELFAHGWGVFMILITLIVLAPRRRRHVLRVAACAAGSGLAAQLMKLTVLRQRPKLADLQASVWSTFQGWFPFSSGGSELHSFPSGHTATAVGLAVGLSFLLPRGRWLFAVFAVLAALQRIESQAHFLSDTLVGGALACLIAGLCTDRRALGKWFDRWEG